MEGDIRVGGTLHITMHGPKGSPWDIDLPMVKRYREIVPGKKLVFENEPVAPDGKRLLDSVTTVTFADHPDGTLLEMTTTARALNKAGESCLDGMLQGWHESFDKLGRLLQG